MSNSNYNQHINLLRQPSRERSKLDVNMNVNTNSSNTDQKRGSIIRGLHEYYYNKI
jgi:hypothetical protein